MICPFNLIITKPTQSRIVALSPALRREELNHFFKQSEVCVEAAVEQGDGGNDSGKAQDDLAALTLPCAARNLMLDSAGAYCCGH